MIRYRRLGYLALNVGDLDRSQAFYRDVVGLQPVDEPSARQSADYRLLRCSDKSHDLALFPGKPGLKRIGFELASAQELAPLRHALEAHGVPCCEIPEQDRIRMRTGAGIRTVEPVTGCTLDFYDGGPHLPPTTHAAHAAHAAHPPYTPTVARIQRLGHVVLRSADYAATIRFFTDVLNFQVSDSIDNSVTFMRCFPNPLHHSFAVGDGRDRNGLHHFNFMVSDMDDIGASLWRLQRLGVPIVNGPGRHLPSESIFLYFLDPDGLTVEYSFGMEEFPESGAREPRCLPRERKSFDLWEGPVDPRKSAVGDIEVADLSITGRERAPMNR
jgi:2,3-dihydroxy-p-cumate/2,3-dihydroxybenzoate 3,4-dioxygenase